MRVGVKTAFLSGRLDTPRPKFTGRFKFSLPVRSCKHFDHQRETPHDKGGGAHSGVKWRRSRGKKSCGRVSPFFSVDFYLLSMFRLAEEGLICGGAHSGVKWRRSRGKKSCGSVSPFFSVDFYLLSMFRLAEEGLTCDES
ncbi:unnamed protein product [Protopolystoma xenopodis]|uniref:Uncharacterized protein n=1 Tax=Protopolystoma xenopodis TaxID=117903 RepID=A0A448XMC0_9PLAT|nr:unnamed protein product [Protopolystoma xenopodis]